MGALEEKIGYIFITLSASLSLPEGLAVFLLSLHCKLHELQGGEMAPAGQH